MSSSSKSTPTKKKSSGSSTSGKKKSKSKKSSKSTKRRVKFSNEVACQFIMMLDEYTEDELFGSWYTPEEYADMENECDTTATEFLDTKKPLPPHLCGRGLECWTLEGEKVKEQNVATGMDYVWDAQLEHWNKHPPGESKSSKDEINKSLENIAKSYLGISVPCHEAASEVGKQDEKAVQSYLTVARSIEQTRKKMQSIGGSKSKGAKRIIRRAPSNTAKAKPKPKATPPPEDSGYVTPTSDDEDTKKAEKTTTTATLIETEKGKEGEEKDQNSKSSKKKGVSSSKEKDPKPSVAKVRRISFRPKSECPLSPGASINSYKSEVSASKIARGHRRSLQLSSSASVQSEEGNTRRRVRRSSAFKSSASVV